MNNTVPTYNEHIHEGFILQNHSAYDVDEKSEKKFAKKFKKEIRFTLTIKDVEIVNEDDFHSSIVIKLSNDDTVYLETEQGKDPGSTDVFININSQGRQKIEWETYMKPPMTMLEFTMKAYLDLSGF